MTAAGALGALLERVERCGPKGDRELDEALCDAFGKRTASGLPSFNGGLGIPAFTRSLDDAVTLVERVLPGWAWSCGTCVVSNDAWVKPDVKGPDVHLCDAFDEGFFGDAKGGSVPLSLLVAMLQGLIAKVEHEQAHGTEEAAKGYRCYQEWKSSRSEAPEAWRPNGADPDEVDASQTGDADDVMAEPSGADRHEPGVAANHPSR